jgi:hypothetical protein
VRRAMVCDDDDYSDLDLPTVIALLDENGAAYTASTLRRLLRERDEAREAARVLADAMLYGSDYYEDMYERARGYRR